MQLARTIAPSLKRLPALAAGPVSARAAHNGRAALCRTHNGPEAMLVEDLTFSPPKPGQVVVEVRACGVNFPDLLLTQGKYQFKPDFPFAPGGEVAGVVVAAGEGTARKIGDEVIAMTGWGGFATHVNVSAKNTFPKPPSMPFQEAAALLMTYGTCMFALETRAQLQPGEWVVITGSAGGIGTAAIEICRCMGARVIAVASTQEKRDLCLKLGAEHAIDYADLKSIKKLTDGKGADVILDSVGSEYAETALRQIAWNGRFLVIGFAGGAIPKMPLNLPLLKNCSIVGVFWGAWLERAPEEAARHLGMLSKWYDQGGIKPLVTKAYSLETSVQALLDFQARKVQGKIVVTPTPISKL